MNKKGITIFFLSFLILGMVGFTTAKILKTSDIKDVIIEGNLIVNAIPSNVMEVLGEKFIVGDLNGHETDLLFEMDILSGDTWLRNVNLFTINGDTLVDGGDFSVNLLNGEGNAYACVDANGKFFRSLEPCIS